MNACTCQTESHEIEMWLPSRLLGPGYEVSDKGRGRSLSYRQTGKIGILKQNRSAIYPRLGRTGAMFSTHVLIADAFIGKRPEGLEVNHKDGDKTNNRKDNLEYCTPKENIRHSFEHGLAPNQKGSRNPGSKLTEEDVIEIRKLKGVMSHREIGIIFGVCQPTITCIINRKFWRHVQ